MDQIEHLITLVGNTPDCIVLPPLGIPTVRDGHILPDDLHRFYELCGGMTLFEEASSSMRIVSPDELKLANPVIIENWSEEEMRSGSPDDISWSWYVLATGANSQYITIDLSPERLGRCYDSFWEIHPQDSEIIATSFTDLLSQLLDNGGHHFYWLEPGFESLGSAYS